MRIDREQIEAHSQEALVASLRGWPRNQTKEDE
jgi:hypothetical protein